jgi:hypothetical protein
MNIRELQRLLAAMESAGFTQRELNSERLRAAVLSIERAAREAAIEECAEVCRKRGDDLIGNTGWGRLSAKLPMSLKRLSALLEGS